MIQDFVNALADHCEAALTATRSKAFLKEVEHFNARLHALPGHPAADLSSQQSELVTSLSDQMIELIERRIDGGSDDATVRRSLAELVYAIRRNMERIYRWRKRSLG